MRSLFSTYPRQPTSSASSSSLLPHSSCNTSPRQRNITQTKLVLCDSACTASSSITHYGTGAALKYARGCTLGDENDDDDDIAVTVTVKPIGSPSSSYSSFSSISTSTSTSSGFDAAMSIRNKAKRQVRDFLSPSNPSNATGHGRPTTPTSPVQIPKQNYRESIRHVKKDNVHHRRRPKHAHSPDAISPSVAALLAITDIPRPQRKRRSGARTPTVDEVVSDQHVSEKDLCLSLSRGPLDLLLSPPEDLVDDDFSATESNIGSLIARTISADSVPSLAGESFATDLCSSVDTPRSISIPARRRPMRKSLEPIRSPPDATEEHPLAVLDDLDFEELHLPPAVESVEDATSYPLLQPFKPLRSAFKSNLTASLRALRSAAKSFSSINFPSIPADDFLTRSILTIDPNVPYMDERRPPVTEEMPSAELRRYLNPTTTRLDSQPTARTNGFFSASIQMQTYKVQRSRSTRPSPRTPYTTDNATPPTAAQRNAGNSTIPQPMSKAAHQIPHVPGMRQREMRENPDFIRIAVMEMAMRRRGKLDNQTPGRARWALPPRRPPTKPYEVGPSGVPTRWIPVTY